jgi:molybdopterin synthase catalytic subunit
VPEGRSAAHGPGPWAQVTRDPIRPERVLEQVGDAGHGAVLLFLGTVRNHADGRPVSGLRYEAYESMAEEVLLELVQEAAARAGTDRVVAVHRIGELGIGEVSVALAISTPHRAEAFEAARTFMDDLKKRLPVWKHEAYVDGSRDWVDGEEIQPPSDPRSPS